MPNLENGIIKFYKLDITFKLPEYIDWESVQQIDIRNCLQITCA